jgi:hypothetical protein
MRAEFRVLSTLIPSVAIIAWTPPAPTHTNGTLPVWVGRRAPARNGGRMHRDAHSPASTIGPAICCRHLCDLCCDRSFFVGHVASLVHVRSRAIAGALAHRLRQDVR